VLKEMQILGPIYQGVGSQYKIACSKNNTNKNSWCVLDIIDIKNGMRN
jgi:hypothetical protein